MHGTDQHHVEKLGKWTRREVICRSPEHTLSPVFVRIGKARDEPYPYIPNLKVVVRFNFIT